MKSIVLIFCGLAVLTFNVGCASLYVAYHRDADVVSNGPSNIPCEGSVGVTRKSGTVHFGVHGPWRDSEFYGIFFRRGISHPEEFYFTVHDGAYPRVADSKGRVRVEGRQVTIDVQYRDQSGAWISPPINGRHKIDSVYPDDIQNVIDAAKKKPNQALLPTPMSVTPPAGQEARQP